MKESFDPLAEAERRSDPQLVRYNEAIGHDPSANADYAAYLRTRDFEDPNGNIHDAKTSRFKEQAANIDPYEADVINSAHAEALEEDTLRASSLDALAKKVAEARQSGNTEAAAYVEDLFFDKFTKLSEKYGWGEEDGSANDTLSVGKDAKVNRTTIDDRLARYSKIMYGEEGTDAGVKSSGDIAKEDIKEADRAEKESANALDEELEGAPASEEEKFDVAAEVEQAKVRLEQLGREREQQVNEERNGGEVAKADRELIARVSKEGLEDLGEVPRIQRVSTEGLEVEEDGKISRVSTEGLDDLFEDDESAPEQTKSNRVKRAWKNFSDAFDRASATLGYGLTKASQKFLHRGGRKENETSEEYEARQQKYGRRVILGTLAVAGAALTVKLASDIDLSDNNAHASGNTETATDTADSGSRGGGEATTQFSKDSLRVDRGEGLFQTFKEMGIPKSKWQEVLDRSGPRLVRMGEAYRDPSVGGFGLNGDGRISERGLRVIADAAENSK